MTQRRQADTERDLALAAADLAADGKALGITILDLREVSSVADYFVVASGRSHIQVEAICDRIAKGIAERMGQKPISVEGLENAQWAVIDYGSVVIHVFQESVRELYDLERLWSLAPRWKHGEEPPPPTSGGDAPSRAPRKRGSTSSTSSSDKPRAARNRSSAATDAPPRPARKRASASKDASAPARKRSGRSDGARSRTARA